VRFSFAEEKLRQLYSQAIGREAMPAATVNAFFEIIAMIESAADERDLIELMSLSYVAFPAPSDEVRSLRLDPDCAMIITLENDADGTVVRIGEIVRNN
jgi:plasmid maintenance system killer protein